VRCPCGIINLATPIYECNEQGAFPGSDGTVVSYVTALGGAAVAGTVDYAIVCALVAKRIFDELCGFPRAKHFVCFDAGFDNDIVIAAFRKCVAHIQHLRNADAC